MDMFVYVYVSKTGNTDFISCIHRPKVFDSNRQTLREILDRIVWTRTIEKAHKGKVREGKSDIDIRNEIIQPKLLKSNGIIGDDIN